jgi:predicted TIM-barrel fold metal-dependent hydrolase
MTPRGANPDFRFIDVHHHLWDLERHPRPWLASDDAGTRAVFGDYAELRRSWLLDDYLREARPLGLATSVHVEGGWDGDPVDETAWLDGLSRAEGVPAGAIAAVDLCGPDVARLLERHGAFRVFRGIRVPGPASIVAEPSFRRGFAELARRGLSCELGIRAGDADAGVALAAAFPDTTIVVAATGSPPSFDTAELGPWRSGMERIAEAPNVVIELTAFGMIDHAWTPERIRPWILAAVDMFGPERCMFASNWPVDRLYAPLANLVGAFRSIVAGFTPDEQHSLFRGTAERVHRI